MRLIAIVFFAFIACGVSFAADAQWQSAAGTALVASLFIIGLLYAVSIAFSLHDLKFLATEEFYQLIATVLMVAFLFSAETATNEIFSSIAPNLQDAGIARINASLEAHVAIFNKVKGYMVSLVPESTKSMYCGLNGAGFSISPCGSFSALIQPVTMSLQLLSLAITELTSLKVLAWFGKAYAFTMLLPIGILLRTLRFTRGAGALFIGLAVALYLFLPISVIFMDEITSPAPDPNTVSMPEPSCDVNRFSDEWGFDYSNADEAKDEFNTLLNNVDSLAYLFLIRGTIVTIACIVAFFTSFKWISKLAGAEVDVSALMRIS